MTQRYERLADRLGIVTTFHKLGHYSATELILGGVNVRTVAGRLVHAGGGTTTLRTYVAWVSEADQRAATGLGAGMPQRPVEIDPVERVKAEPRHPYEVLAADIARRVDAGELVPGNVDPTAVELAEAHGCSVATARRGVALAKEWGVLANDSHGRPRVAARPAAMEVLRPHIEAAVHLPAASLWSVTLRGPRGVRSSPRLVRASITDPDTFRPHLLGIARIEIPDLPDGDDGWVSDYELEVRNPQSDDVAAIVLRWTGRARSRASRPPGGSPAPRVRSVCRPVRCARPHLPHRLQDHQL